jgi:hypothetical protein
MGRFPRSIVCVFGVVKLLALSKPSGGIKPIAMGEVLYWLINRALCFSFQDEFSFHLSPHQFGVVVKGGCEAVVDDI